MATPSAPPQLPPQSIEANRYGNQAFITIQAVFVGIASLLVLARLYVRHFIIKSVGLDELFIVIALVRKPRLERDRAWGPRQPSNLVNVSHPPLTLPPPKEAILPTTQPHLTNKLPLTPSASLEVNIGIIAATIPTLRPLFSRSIRLSHKKPSANSNSNTNSRYFRKIGSSYSASSSRQQQQQQQQSNDEQPLRNMELKDIATSTRGGSVSGVGTAKEGDSLTDISKGGTRFEIKGGDGVGAGGGGGGGFYAKEQEVYDRV
ncbi:MAG: hypothetical protein Q9164_003381 [Protoblastenia rupestris]